MYYRLSIQGYGTLEIKLSGPRRSLAFFFVIAEFIAQGFSIACFNLVAQAEGIRDYALDCILFSSESRSLLRELLASHAQLRSEGAQADRKEGVKLAL